MAAASAPSAASASLATGARSFSALAAVEVQSVLRMLDTASKLRAARCSRHLYRLAQAPFVWQDGAPLVVGTGHANFAARLREHPLLRHAPIELHVEQSRELATAEQALSIPLLHTLSARGWDVEPCEAVLQSPRVQQHLRELHLPPEAPASLLSLVATACASLTALTFDVGLIETAADIEALSAAPCLSSLRLFFVWDSSCSSLLDGLRACSQLTSLSLHDAVLDAAMLAALHSPELTARLQHLTLAGLRIERQSRVLLSQSPAGVFGPLVQLQSLTLGIVYGCSQNLVLQRLPSSLELLEMEGIRITSPEGGSRFELESATLQAALLAAPKLTVRLVVVDAVLKYYQSHRQGGADGVHSRSDNGDVESKPRPEYPDTLRLAAVDPARVQFAAWRGSTLAWETELMHSSV